MGTYVPSRNLTSPSSSCALRATRSKYNVIVIPEGINTRTYTPRRRAYIGLLATHSPVYNPSSHTDIGRYSVADCRRVLIRISVLSCPQTCPNRRNQLSAPSSGCAGIERINNGEDDIHPIGQEPSEYEKKEKEREKEDEGKKSRGR